MLGVDAWWVIHGQDLMDALNQVKNGDDPGIIYAELYANSTHEQVPGGEHG